MGATVSTNIAQSFVNDSLAIANTYAQSCASSLKQNNIVSVNCCCNTTFKNITLGGNDVINVQCLSSESTKSSLQGNIASAMAQKAAAIGQSLGLGITDTTNLIETSTKLAETITNSYTSTCTQELSGTNLLTCNSSNNTVIDNLVIQGANQILANCVQRALSDTTIQSDIQQIIQQSAFAKEENSFAIFAIVGAVIVIAFVITGGLVFKSPAIWVILAIVVLLSIASIAYAFTAQSNKRYPYPR